MKLRGALGFSVLRFCHRFAAFVPMHSGFSALVFVSVCGFSVFQHLIFGFHQNTQEFSDLVSDVVSLRSERQVSVSRETQKFLRGMRDKPSLD